MVAGAGLPSFLYNHVNRSFLVGVGLFDPGVLFARPLLMSLHDEGKVRDLLVIT